MADSPSTKRSRINLESRCPSLRKHFSKSASELSCNDCGDSSPHSSPQRAKSAANPAISGVFQKTHGFFNTLKHRWSRGKSKDRGRQSPIDGSFDNKDSDYAADNSSDHSSPATPHTQSPRHRATTIGDSPLARPRLNTSFKTDESHKTMNQSMDEDQPSSSFATKALTQVQVEEPQKRKEATLRQHSFFQLKVHIISGHNLVAMDKSGTSDPYVKFKAGSRMLYKTKTVHKELNPVWDETFTTPIDDPFQPINIKVFDYDWGLQDDFMGSAQLLLTTLELNRPEDVILRLEDAAKPGKRLGELKLNLTLWPKSQEDKEQMEQTEFFANRFNVSKRFNSISYYQRNPKLAESSRRLKSQIWSSVVTIVLVEAKSLPPETDSGINEPFVKFRLGNEKYKSKTSYRAKWLEQFDLHLFDEDQNLEVVVCGKTTTHGKCIIDLRSLPRERTLGMWKPLEEGQGEIFLLLTISGTTASETITDLTSYVEDPHERTNIKNRYNITKTFQNLRDIGHLTVKVFGATGLAAADLGGKSDPFCVLELVNARLQTQTEYKTLTPNWNKIFTFNVKDMSSVLEVTVFDEDRDHKVEFLGRVAIPLLRIRNGEKRWYALKDKNMYVRAKGMNPQILLEMTAIWSPIKAALRVLEPREEKFVQQENKFKRQIFVKNVTRLKAIIMHVIEFGQFVQSCFEWESPIRSFFALILWVCGCIWFDISTVPAAMLLFLLKNWLVKWLTSGSSASSAAGDNFDVCSDDEDDDDKEKEEKKTIKERLQAIQEVSQTVQNSIGYLASLGESVKNTFNFSVPELSWLTAMLLLAACLVLHFVPIRVLLLLWGLIKFSRRIIRPHTVPNNEVLDLLSRVPDDEEVVMFREIPLTTNPDVTRRDPRKKTKVN